ncbi:hypothetical protein Y888_16070 [Mixta calida B021323]|nr:hypothetical protein Y888_16070 [Mixta calida B021323]
MYVRDIRRDIVIQRFAALFILLKEIPMAQREIAVDCCARRNIPLS